MSFSADLDKERERILRLLQHASVSWAAAMRDHSMAPPDAGFAGRLKRLSEAAATEHVAWEQADAVGLMWRPVPGAENAPPPYELRPGTGRRGPDDLWIRFDRAVADLNQAIAGSSSAVVSAAFGEMADVTAELAYAVARQDEVAELAKERSASRHSAAS